MIRVNWMVALVAAVAMGSWTSQAEAFGGRKGRSHGGSSCGCGGAVAYSAPAPACGATYSAPAPVYSGCGPVAYSAPAGGATQIFVRDLSALTVTQLTFGDKNRGQPVWLRDGRLVFVTFSSLTSASLAWLDPADGVVHEIPIAGISAHHPSAVRP